MSTEMFLASMREDHSPGPYPTHCKTCNLRHPCDMAMILDETDKIRAELAVARDVVEAARAIWKDDRSRIAVLLAEPFRAALAHFDAVRGNKLT